MARQFRLFAYGSLQAPAILRTVTGRVFPARSAWLPDYARFRLRGCPYPGIRPRPGASTPGILYDLIPATAWRRLDEFEGPLYRRVCLTITTVDGEHCDANVYVLDPAYWNRLTLEPWNLGEFEAQEARAFRALCRQPRAKHRALEAVSASFRA